MIHRKRAKDFKEHAKLCERLLRHYSSQYLDRQVYWRARQRSITTKDMLTVIVDTFDRSKLSLPKWPYHRTPKRTCYEMYLRALKGNIFFCLLESVFLLVSYVDFSSAFCFNWGASVVLTAVMVHGHGCFMYLSPQEGMGCGSNWNWECVPLLQTGKVLCLSGFLVKWLDTASFQYPCWRFSKIMRSLEKVWIRCRAQSNPYPPEILGQQDQRQNSVVWMRTTLKKGSAVWRCLDCIKAMAPKWQHCQRNPQHLHRTCTLHAPSAGGIPSMLGMPLAEGAHSWGYWCSILSLCQLPTFCIRPSDPKGHTKKDPGQSGPCLWKQRHDVFGGLGRGGGCFKFGGFKFYMWYCLQFEI